MQSSSEQSSSDGLASIHWTEIATWNHDDLVHTQAASEQLNHLRDLWLSLLELRSQSGLPGSAPTRTASGIKTTFSRIEGTTIDGWAIWLGSTIDESRAAVDGPVIQKMRAIFFTKGDELRLLDSEPERIDENGYDQRFRRLRLMDLETAKAMWLAYDMSQPGANSIARMQRFEGLREKQDIDLTPALRRAFLTGDERSAFQLLALLSQLFAPHGSGPFHWLTPSTPLETGLWHSTDEKPRQPLAIKQRAVSYSSLRFAGEATVRASDALLDWSWSIEPSALLFRVKVRALQRKTDRG